VKNLDILAFLAMPGVMILCYVKVAMSGMMTASILVVVLGISASQGFFLGGNSGKLSKPPL
jgi:hypothetical protein